ncbi:MAG: HPr family phosphocarrier protein [Clostridia bacterium]
MISRKLIVKNPAGLHARPAGILAKEASACKCDVKMLVGTREIQLKSILNIMVAAIKCDTEVELICDGENEAQSMEKLAAIIESDIDAAT